MMHGFAAHASYDRAPNSPIYASQLTAAFVFNNIANQCYLKIRFLSLFIFVILFFFVHFLFLVTYSPVLYYLNAWNMLLLALKDFLKYLFH